MKHFLLAYTLAPDYLERRGALRAAHLAQAWAAAERGELVLGGAVEALGEALLLFAGEDRGAAEAFARSDPYVTGGLVSAWRVREWLTVAGEGAATRCAEGEWRCAQPSPSAMAMWIVLEWPIAGRGGGWARSTCARKLAGSALASTGAPSSSATCGGAARGASARSSAA